ncbi:hypothetical protein [Periweissella fabalis]|uniref:Uncharacterized protein n=1 Tax=Periweissella fabalis TaxID=1070421 RepID=A0A7X6S499_9LACO|nr:hypothetical protein [Periweissella fabalis]MCM0598369.1 hypothetical protein [Periweissella fabalis]NKZ25041.1 hypothetical protein [Periweissella fabalis]
MSRKLIYQIYFLLCMTIFATFLGYVLIAFVHIPISKGNMIKNLIGFNPGWNFFFTHNLLFAIILSVLPFINLLLIFTQLVSFGFNIYFIHKLSLGLQVTLFFRHAIFETAAMFCSVVISLIFYDMCQEFLEDKKINKNKRIKSLIFWYGVMVTLILLAALMEGSAHA